MRKHLRLITAAVLALSVIAVAAPSDEVTFKTDGNAPSGFTTWTFFWKKPIIEPGAKLSYVVIQPDGKEYFRYEKPMGSEAGGSVRSDFRVGFAGGDPSVFYNKQIIFKFMVDKGKITFAPDSTFRFDFAYSVKAVMQ